MIQHAVWLCHCFSLSLRDVETILAACGVWSPTRASARGALIEQAKLPKKVREVANLVTGACFNSRYELYAHEHVAESTGLSLATIATIAAGQRPVELTTDEAVAYDCEFTVLLGEPDPAYD